MTIAYSERINDLRIITKIYAENWNVWAIEVLRNVDYWVDEKKRNFN